MKSVYVVILFFIGCSIVSCTHPSCKTTKPTKMVVAKSYNRKCLVFSSIPPTAKGKKEILFIGHSLVNEFLLDEFMPHEDDIVYVNMGIGGDDTRGMYARRELAFARCPQKMVIEIGVNDLTNSESTDTIMHYYRQFILEAVSRNISLIVCSVIPSRDVFAERTKELNILLKNVCEENDCVFVDMSAMGDLHGKLSTEYDCGDHIHLSGEGYVFWSRMLKTYIYD